MIGGPRRIRPSRREARKSGENASGPSDSRWCGRQGQGFDLVRARFETRLGRGLQGGARRQDVVHEPDARAPGQWLPGAKGAAQIGSTRSDPEVGLRRRIPDALQDVTRKRNAQALRDAPGDRIAVVEPTLAPAPRMQCDRKHQIGSRYVAVRESSSEFIGEELDRDSGLERWAEYRASMFEARNPLPHGTLIAKQRVAAVERRTFGIASGAEVGGLVALDFVQIESAPTVRPCRGAFRGRSPSSAAESAPESTMRATVEEPPPGKPLDAAGTQGRLRPRSRRAARETGERGKEFEKTRGDGTHRAHRSAAPAGAVPDRRPQRRGVQDSTASLAFARGFRRLRLRDRRPRPPPTEARLRRPRRLLPPARDPHPDPAPVRAPGSGRHREYRDRSAARRARGVRDRI